MAAIFHPATGFVLGDPDASPFEEGAVPSWAEVNDAAAGLILSASGWRKVFAAADPGAPRAAWASLPSSTGGASDEDSLSLRVAPADIFIAGTMAKVFVEYLRERSGKQRPTIIMGIDTRPTGPALADAMCRIFLGLGASLRYLFIVPAPEIMAYAKSCSRMEEGDGEFADAFCYISASHNPPGHNGVKFGLAADGGVLSGTEAAKLIGRFREAVAGKDLVRRLLYAAEEADPRAIARIYSTAPGCKRRSLSAYTLLAREMVTGSDDPKAQEDFLEAMGRGAAITPAGIVAELNGSARTLTIDEDFLAGAGVSWRALNSTPRAFAHRIVPEGESLSDCCRALEGIHAENPAFVAGFVPDCDGDRGNLVIFDQSTGRGRVLAAQEVFALCCIAESAQLVREGSLTWDSEGKPTRRVAIAVNDGTSMRIEAIGEAFGIEIHRAETGEANVVGLANGLRAQGCIVRILGEGSNGGNITWPAAVRDPLATVGALFKLLLLRDIAEPPRMGEASGLSAHSRGLFHIWMERSGRASGYRPDFTLADVIGSLPAFSTTSAFEPLAALKISTMDHARLKAAYRELFLLAWERDRGEFARRFGVQSWEAFSTTGSAEVKLGLDFASSGKGGLRVVFLDKAGKGKAFVWMRGSGTEAVFRVMADVDASTGDGGSGEGWLLDWHRSLVLEADARART